MSELKQVHCPSCKATLRFRRTASSIVAVTCPTCAHAFEVRFPAAKPAANTSPTSSPVRAGNTSQPIVAKPVIAKPVIAKPVSPSIQSTESETLSPAASSTADLDFGAFAEAPPTDLSADFMRPVLIPKRKPSSFLSENPWVLPVAIGGAVACFGLILALVVVISSVGRQSTLARTNSGTDSQEGTTLRQEVPSQANTTGSNSSFALEQESAATKSSITENSGASTAVEALVIGSRTNPNDSYSDERSSGKDEDHRPAAGSNFRKPNLDAFEQHRARVQALRERSRARMGLPRSQPHLHQLLTGPDSLTIHVTNSKTLDSNGIRDQMRVKLASSLASAVLSGDDLMLKFRYSGTLADVAPFIDFGTIELSDSQNRTIYVDASQP